MNRGCKHRIGRCQNCAKQDRGTNGQAEPKDGDNSDERHGQCHRCEGKPERCEPTAVQQWKFQLKSD
jgi:hypothetical protein